MHHLIPRFEKPAGRVSKVSGITVFALGRENVIVMDPSVVNTFN